MQRRVQHNDGKAQHVAGVGVGENVRIQLAVPLGKAFHHPVNLLRLSRQPERPQELPKIKQRCEEGCALVKLILLIVEKVLTLTLARGSNC